MPRNPRSKSARAVSPTLFLDLFYPFHYRAGHAVEQALRGDFLTQHQTVILWIIHSEGESGQLMRRKEIEARIGTWFDITSSAISKALRSLARADMPFLEIREDPQSGREKLVLLTPAGQELVEKMIERSEKLIARIVEELTDDEIQSGLQFMRRVSIIVQNMEQERKVS